MWADWVHDKGMIVRNYLSGWFVIDAVSITPFYAISWSMEGERASGDGREASNLLSSVRVIKLLRMIKLARVLKASRILKRCAARSRSSNDL